MKAKALPLLLFCFFAYRLYAQQSANGNGDSITVSIAPEYDKVSKAHRLLFGESYRKLWAAPVRVRVFHLEREKGGLMITGKGGGLQTKSLRLTDTSGREWVLRSIQKYPERALPAKLKATIAKDILQDQVVTGHPYAALTVPPFAEALGIPHANPEIVFVPDDTALGEYRKDFANSVLLFEEREPFGANTDRSEKAQRKLQENNDAGADQKMVLRARLLDIFLGDWDRHEDQWRWDKKTDGNETLYIPLPRDRDKVYYNTSGIFPWLLSRQSLKSNLQGFRKDIRDIKGYNFNNRYFDRYFLIQLGEDDWNREIDDLQNLLTDSLIKTSIKLLPDTIYSLSSRKIINTLIARRSMLRKEALKYYHFISKTIDIPASDKKEFFEIDQKPDKNISVTIYKIKKDAAKGKVIYNRSFDHNITKEIRLYGFAGNDVFSITGAKKSSIKVRMIGGAGKDSFYVDTNIDNKRKLYVYDRFGENNILPDHYHARIRTSIDSAINDYDNHNFKYDKFGPSLSLQYNLDQGFLYRGGFLYEKHGFRKEPFAEKHLFVANYATERESFMFTYYGYLTRVISNNDISINVVSRGPKNVANFFGIGNETEFNKKGEDAMSYYRNRYDYLTGDVRLHKRLTKSLEANGGIAAQYYTSSSQNNTSRFFKSFNTLHPEENVFSNRFLAGVIAGAEVNTRDNSAMPSKGIYWNTEITGMKQLNADKKAYGQLTTQFSLYIPVFNDSNIVIANRVGWGTTVGEPSFFQHMQLGGVHNLRGFHTNRFTGRSIFYHNADLRFKLLDFDSYLLPGTIGIVGFNDVGRVWAPAESSDKWHHGYGGGIYIVPAELILVQAVVGHSVEGTLPYISIGFSF